MLRSILVLCALTLIPAVVLAGDEMAGETEMVDNPVYQSWAGFEPGSSATYTCTTTAGDVIAEVTLTYTLEEATEDKVVLTLETVTASDEGEEETVTQTIECPASIEKPAEAPEAVAQGKETIQVGDEELIVSCTKTTSDEATTTVWTCSTVPGGTVKSITESTVEGETTTVAMALTSYSVTGPAEVPPVDIDIEMDIE
ncbi:MAG: hypothetical protein JW889_00520 [Verrucomicrobia bacterium]|nr:hypothetical protein [Verrucomicrobiota bacterium]